jgi:hypothetical protein
MEEAISFCDYLINIYTSEIRKKILDRKKAIGKTGKISTFETDETVNTLRSYNNYIQILETSRENMCNKLDIWEQNSTEGKETEKTEAKGKETKRKEN